MKNKRGYMSDKYLVIFFTVTLLWTWGCGFIPVMFIPSTMLLSFFVTFVYIKTKRSILAGALVHMFSNLIGSQLLAPYTTEISAVIRYTNMAFFGIVIFYAYCSKKFRRETVEQINRIKTEEEGFFSGSHCE